MRNSGVRVYYRLPDGCKGRIYQSTYRLAVKVLLRLRKCSWFDGAVITDIT